MLKTLRNALKIKDIRTKILYTFFMLVVVRIGAQLPVPGVDRAYFANWFASQTGDAFNFFDAVTGGSFLSMSIFALNITPYITSSIIMQLLTIAIPKLEEMQKDGEDGRKKIAEITRYVTVGLGLIEGIAMAVGFGRQGLLEEYNFINVLTVVAALMAGTTFLMWMGERITEKGVGNGISIILMINIISRVPSDFTSLYDQFMKGKNPGIAALAGLIIVAVVVVTVAFVVVLQGGQRKIPVQYAKKIQGRKMVGGQSTHIPLKVNTAGVIPIIFASSLLQFPTVIMSIIGKNDIGGFWGHVLKGLNSSNWCDFSEPVYSIGLLVYIVLVVFFAYFYTSITFNPIEVANNMKKQGGFIPGIRPGKPTTDYLTRILNYIIFIGASGLIIVAVVPIFFSGVFNASVSFGGTSLIIIVGVILETMKQIESQMLVRYYKGFLND
ncbi:preprotein translocase subunit SecY [Anaerobium acetethylicum]|uniref:Protein translocase subunit SecY n=1 Tax=Anaerobium acetethylicum TaxID=1619234 RepID=A0A1D3TUX6_9FIRM|nr:preprotein translocase subunit SecY [Anaerobium acetethylicum]SCP97874.1 preprotein translocase subunit SecY [Anaerobium acetethylicum]